MTTNAINVQGVIGFFRTMSIYSDKIKFKDFTIHKDSAEFILINGVKIEIDSEGKEFGTIIIGEMYFIFNEVEYDTDSGTLKFILNGQETMSM